MQQRCDGNMYQNKVVHLVGISEKRLISTMEFGSLACPPTQDKNVYEHSQNAVKTSGVCQVSHFVTNRNGFYSNCSESTAEKKMRKDTKSPRRTLQGGYLNYIPFSCY